MRNTQIVQYRDTACTVTVVDETTPISTTGELIATNLRRIRSVRRLPQSEIAGRMAARGWNWTAAKVSLTEAGKRGLSFDEVADLCAALEAPLSDLLSTDGFEVTDEVHFRAAVLTKAADPWAFGPATDPLKAAAAEAKRAETLRRVEGRIAASLGVTRGEVVDLADGLYQHDVLTERDRLVQLWEVEALAAGVDAMDLAEPHVARRDATLHIIEELREDKEQGERDLAAERDWAAYHGERLKP